MSENEELPAEVCPFCESTQAANVTFCTNCGYPVKGDKFDKQKFMNQLDRLRENYFYAKRSVKWGIYLMLFVGAMHIVVAYFWAPVANVIIGFLFFILFGYGKSKQGNPSAALISAIGLFVAAKLFNLFYAGRFPAPVELFFPLIFYWGALGVAKEPKLKQALSKNKIVRAKLFPNEN